MTTDYATPYPALPARPPNDRRTWLIVFGIFALIIGGLSACLTILTPLGLLMASAMQRQPGLTRGATPTPIAFPISRSRSSNSSAAGSMSSNGTVRMQADTSV